jgi:Skp family chaperone for outer membrane proteins
MSTRRLFAFTLLTGSISGVANAAPAVPQGLGGTPVVGICFLSREAVFGNAKVGRAAAANMQRLTALVQAEIDAMRKPVEVEIKTLQIEGEKLAPDLRRTRQQALSVKLKAVQGTTEQRTRELETARAKAAGRIAVALQPVIAKVYAEKNCGLLIDRNHVLGGNLSNDLTAGAVAGLDAVMSSISFEREAEAAVAGGPAG